MVGCALSAGRIGMPDELLDQPVSPHLFFDGISDLHIDTDVFRCVLYSKHRVAGEDRKVEVARLACPASELPDIINQIVTSLTHAARVLVRVKVQDGH